MFTLIGFSVYFQRVHIVVLIDKIWHRVILIVSKLYQETASNGAHMLDEDSGYSRRKIISKGMTYF